MKLFLRVKLISVSWLSPKTIKICIIIILIYITVFVIIIITNYSQEFKLLKKILMIVFEYLKLDKYQAKWLSNWFTN